MVDMNKAIMAKNRKALSFLWLATLILSIPVALVGIMLYQRSFSNYEVTSQSKTGILLGRYPYHNWSISSLDLQVAPAAKKLYLELQLYYETAGNYSIAVTLPYRIASIGTFKIPPDEGKWNYSNALSGSVVVVTLDAKNLQGGSQTVSANFTLQDSIADKIFEVYSIVLPFGGSLTPDVQREWENLQSIAPFAMIGDKPEGSLHILIPSSAMITASSHTIVERTPAKGSQQELDFRITEYTPFFIQYSDPSERYIIEDSLFLSGILFGSAISAVVSALILTVIAALEFVEERIREHKTALQKPQKKETI